MCEDPVRYGRGGDVMRSGLDEFVAVGLGFLVIAVVAAALYRPRIQRSTSYQATVVPLANIMDVGFIILSPAIVLIAGFRAPFVMLAICLVAIAARGATVRPPVVRAAAELGSSRSVGYVVIGCTLQPRGVRIVRSGACRLDATAGVLPTTPCR